MSHKLDKTAKQVKDKHQVILNDLLREEANRYCADCEAKGPRWASWNLGVFLCIRCAGIHRNLGVHISRVKSVNLDSWTAAQMESIQSWGNKRAKEYYECYLPTDFLRPQGDSAMETLIRNKYERKLYIRKGGEPPKNKLKDQTEQIKPQGRDKQQENKQEKLSRIAAEKKIPQKSSPQQPKLTSVSRPSGSNVQQPQPKAPQTVDLLGMDAASEPAPQQTLNQNQDEFSLFMGAAPISNQNPQSQIGNIPPQASQSKNSNLVQNGSSLLLEEMATTKANTKESILSLYQSGSQPQKQMFGVPGGVYMPQQQAPGFGIQGSSQKQMMGPAQHPVGINQQGMKMNQPQAPVGQYQFGMNQQQMGMNQQQMGMNQQQMGMNQHQMGMNQHQMGMNQQQMGMNQHQMGMNQHQTAGMNQRQMGIMSQQAGIQGNFVGITQNNFGANTNANMVNSNVRMQTSQPGMSNMMAMQNQMQNMNLGQNSQSNQFYNSNNQMMNKQNSAQFTAANFQVNLGQNLMATGYGGNKQMMPSQQPILANGPAVGMGFANANLGMSQNMGHTLNNQLWK